MTKKLGYSLHKVARLWKDSSNSLLQRVSSFVYCDIGCMTLYSQGFIGYAQYCEAFLASMWKEVKVKDIT